MSRAPSMPICVHTRVTLIKIITEISTTMIDRKKPRSLDREINRSGTQHNFLSHSSDRSRSSICVQNGRLFTKNIHQPHSHPPWSLHFAFVIESSKVTHQDADRILRWVSLINHRNDPVRIKRSFVGERTIAQRRGPHKDVEKRGEEGQCISCNVRNTSGPNGDASS